MVFIKEVSISLPSRKREVIDEFLQLYNIKADILLGENAIRYIFVVKDNQTNQLLHELKKRGIGNVFGRVVISDISTVIVPSSESGSDINSSPGANVEEIRSVLEGSAVLSFDYVTLVILSAILASYGLVDNNVVIIIGSMIVAPLMGPIALTSLGALLPGSGLLRKGIIAEVFGIVATVLVGYFVGIIAHIDQVDPLPQEIMSRANLNQVVIIFAVVSGFAAGLIISKGSNISIVGVAIAASLAPPAAAIGLFLAANKISLALNATTLLMMNILAINLACSVMFFVFGLAGKSGESKRSQSIASRTNILLIIGGAILLSILIYVILG
ncbi:MAG: TIGR00341 family protein [Methanobacteriota archaeon]|nr:MAG: TIGR00341 family protein [Euryarchaeota archaeon]